jgi:hypothetical protein
MCKIDCVFFIFYTVPPSASSKGAALTGSGVFANDYKWLLATTDQDGRPQVRRKKSVVPTGCYPLDGLDGLDDIV